jgi:hypothetical protein
MALKELGGWRTIQMVQKYAHFAPSHLAPRTLKQSSFAQ